MPSLTARVELHNASGADYDVLHAAMQTRGFARTITADTGKVYWLPTGTYDCSAAAVTAAVGRDIAVEAAKQTGRTYEVLVVERPVAAWIGLTEKRY